MHYRYAAFSNNQKIVSILHEELECKAEKLKHMKLEVTQPKIQNKSELPACEYTSRMKCYSRD